MKAYTTAQGDMWDLIAHAQLGDAAHTDKLMGANRQHLSHYIFPAGVVLFLPDVPPDVPDSLPPWRRGTA